VATYIRQEISKYAEVSMKIDFNKFSKRQIKNIVKQLRNGAVSYGHSATATVAQWLLRKYPMPHFRYDSYYIKGRDLPFDHPFFNKLKEISSIAKLNSDLSEWEKECLEDAIKYAEENKATFETRVYRYDKHNVKQLKKAMVMDNVIDGELKDFLDKMERRELGLVDVNFYDFADSY
jgi:ribosomal protein L22